MHSRATDRRSASKCHGKCPDQTLDKAFGLSEVLVAVSTSRLFCKKAGKTRTLMPVWDSSGESRFQSLFEVDLREKRWLIYDSQLFGGNRCRVALAVRRSAEAYLAFSGGLQSLRSGRPLPIPSPSARWSIYQTFADLRRLAATL